MFGKAPDLKKAPQKLLNQKKPVSAKEVIKDYLSRRDLYKKQLEYFAKAKLDPSADEQSKQESLKVRDELKKAYGLEDKDLSQIAKNATEALAAIDALPDAQAINAQKEKVRNEDIYENVEAERFLDPSNIQSYLHQLSKIYRGAIYYERNSTDATLAKARAYKNKLRERVMTPGINDDDLLAIRKYLAKEGSLTSSFSQDKIVTPPLGKDRKRFEIVFQNNLDRSPVGNEPIQRNYFVYLYETNKDTTSSSPSKDPQQPNLPKPDPQEITERIAKVTGSDK